MAEQPNIGPAESSDGGHGPHSLLSGRDRKAIETFRTDYATEMLVLLFTDLVKRRFREESFRCAVM